MGNRQAASPLTLDDPY